MKRSLACILIFVLIIGMMSGCSNNTTNSNTQISIISPDTTIFSDDESQYKIFAENDYLTLKIHTGNASLIVYNKSNNTSFSTIPKDKSIDNEFALFDIEYIDSQGSSSSMNAYSDAIQKGQFKIDQIENGAKISLTLGNANIEAKYPLALTKERYDEVLSNISTRYDKMKIKSYYWLVEIEKISDATEKKELLSSYKELDSQPLYVLQKNNLTLSEQKELNRIFEDSGYTDKDYEEDSKYFAVSSSESKFPMFNVNMYITLDKNNFNVCIPIDEIEEFNDAQLTRISLLKSLGAPDEAQTGNFLLPDETGSSMSFYNTNGQLKDYSVPVYGTDESISLAEKIQEDSHAYLPFWAIVNEDKVLFAIIEDSISLATIQASPKTESNQPRAYATFQIRNSQKISVNTSQIDQNESLYVVQKERYGGNIKISYHLLTGDYNDYNKLASYYKTIIYSDSKVQPQKALPTYIEFIGVANNDTTFLGMKTTKKVVYTTIQDVIDIGNDLLKSGCTNLVFNLKGFFGYGLDQGFLSRVKPLKEVGDESDWDNLSKWAKENDITIYYDFDVQYNSLQKPFDGFSKNRDAAVYLNKLIAEKQSFNKATYLSETTRGSKNYILNLSSTLTSIDNILNYALNNECNYISLRNIGNILNSDFNEKNPVSRETAKNELQSSIASLKEKNIQLMTTGTNSWVLPYVSDYLDIPLNSAGFEITDSSVPFLPLILTGHSNYCGSAINLNGNTRENILDIIRTGAGLHYVITCNENENFTQTNHLDLFSTKYSVWKDDIINNSSILQTIRDSCSNEIISINQVADKIYKTQYSNGSCIFTNYSEDDVIIDGIQIKALDYSVVAAGRETN